MIKNSIKYFYNKIRLQKNNEIKTCNLISRKAKISNSSLSEGVRVADFASLKASKVGYLTSIGRNSKITHSDIGKFCAISWDVTINAIQHPLKNISISAFPYVPEVGGYVEERKQSYNRVYIKNDVWIGAHALIMPGVTVGNGAIIGGGAVVTKNVPDYAIVGGVPAKVIKYRFDKEMIERLLQCKWWGLDSKLIKSNIHLFQSELNEESLEKLENLCKEVKTPPFN